LLGIASDAQDKKLDADRAGFIESVSIQRLNAVIERIRIIRSIRSSFCLNNQL